MGPAAAVWDARSWPLVGRDADLARIAAARRDDAVTGIVLSAAAGVGKSRLARQALRDAEDDGAHVERVNATRSAATVPLGALAALIPADVRAGDALETMRRCADGICVRAAGRPIVLGVDDAHLLDPMSAALVLHLVVERIAFVVASVRGGEPAPDAVESLWKDAGAERLRVEPLTEERIALLVETVLDGPVEHAVLRWLFDTSQGNVLYARELLLGALADGLLERVDDLWRLSSRPAPSASLAELVTSRIRTVSAEAGRALELLALGEPLRLAGDPRTPDDALRVARWLLDAGERIPAGLLLEAARAAGASGDPDLGARLAALAVDAGAGTPASLLLARAHTVRGRHEEAEALVERGRTWWPGEAWQRPHAADLRPGPLIAGFDGVAATSEQLLADPALEDEVRGRMELVHLANLYFTGRAREANERVRAMRPGLAAGEPAYERRVMLCGIVPLETGEDWPQLEAWSEATLRDAVGRNDHFTAGVAAGLLALIAYMRGRFADAMRRHAEAEAGLERHDGAGALFATQTMHIATAAAMGDAATATEMLVRVADTALAKEPPANMRAYLARARAWHAVAQGDLTRARAILLEAAGEVGDMPLYAAKLAYESMRIGTPAREVAVSLGRLRERCDAPLVAAYAVHAAARAASDGAALARVAEDMAAIGADLYAMEAAAHAAEAFATAGRQDSARRAAARARELHAAGQGAPAPVIPGVDARAVALTARERELVALAARGLTNGEIAARLVLSVRTVESHLYRAMAKLGVSDRRELRA